MSLFWVVCDYFPYEKGESKWDYDTETYHIEVCNTIEEAETYCENELLYLLNEPKSLMVGVNIRVLQTKIENIELKEDLQNVLNNPDDNLHNSDLWNFFSDYDYLIDELIEFRGFNERYSYV